MNIPKVSVLTPVYGAEARIARCVESLFAQTYNNIEFVFVNDCTKDKSIEILKSVLLKFPQRHNSVKIINHEKNQGVAAARNTLLENATGEFILWVDADDFIEKDTLSLTIREQEKKNADIVCFGTALYTASGIKPFKIKEIRSSLELITDIVANRTPTALWGHLIKRTLFTENNIRFIPGLNVGEDMLVMVQLAYYSQIIANVSKILYYYDKTNEASIVNTYSIDKALQELNILKSIGLFLDGKVNVEKYLEERRLNIYVSNIYQACICNNKKFYKDMKAQIKAGDWNKIKKDKNLLYRFFLVTNNYNLNRIWAYFIFVVKQISKYLKKI